MKPTDSKSPDRKFEWLLSAHPYVATQGFCECDLVHSVCKVKISHSVLPTSTFFTTDCYQRPPFATKPNNIYDFFRPALRVSPNPFSPRRPGSSGEAGPFRSVEDGQDLHGPRVRTDRVRTWCLAVVLKICERVTVCELKWFVQRVGQGMLK